MNSFSQMILNLSYMILWDNHVLYAVLMTCNISQCAWKIYEFSVNFFSVMVQRNNWDLWALRETLKWFDLRGSSKLNWCEIFRVLKVIFFSSLCNIFNFTNSKQINRTIQIRRLKSELKSFVSLWKVLEYKSRIMQKLLFLLILINFMNNIEHQQKIDFYSCCCKFVCTFSIKTFIMSKFVTCWIHVLSNVEDYSPLGC